MYGQITKFRDDIGVGVISAENGRKYRFHRSEIVSHAAQLIGQNVNFLLDASRASEIITLSGSPWTAFGGISAHAS